MNTFTSTTTTRMTTQQLIEECAKQGVIVTTTKLARWVKEGLIPGLLRHRHGLGQGNGTEWLWDAECLPRAVIIGHSLSNDRSLLHAARTLAETGYALSPVVLSKVLLDCLAIFERTMVIRQTYIGSSYSQEEQYKRFRRHVRQKTPDMPDSTFDAFSAFISALLGLIPDDALVPESMKQMQQILSLLSVKERLETIDGSFLMLKYKEAGQMIPTFIPLIVGTFNDFFLPVTKQLLKKRGQDSTTLLANIDLQKLQECVQVDGERIITSNLGIGRLRLYLTILLAILPSDNETLIKWAKTLLSLISGVSEYLGFLPSTIISLIEDSKKNESE